MGNIFTAIPHNIETEIFEDLHHSEDIRIERILSKGHSSPAEGWYDQEENEWVVVLQGASVLVFEDGREVRLAAGDYVNIPAGEKHRVAWTDQDMVTVWLAIFYKK